MTSTLIGMTQLRDADVESANARDSAPRAPAADDGGLRGAPSAATPRRCTSSILRLEIALLLFAAIVATALGIMWAELRSASRFVVAGSPEPPGSAYQLHGASAWRGRRDGSLAPPPADVPRRAAAVLHQGSGQWVEKPPMPAPRSDLQAVAVGTQVYLLGGLDGNGAVSDAVVSFDTVFETYNASHRPMRLPRCALAVAAHLAPLRDAPRHSRKLSLRCGRSRQRGLLHRRLRQRGRRRQRRPAGQR